MESSMAGGGGGRGAAGPLPRGSAFRQVVEEDRMTYSQNESDSGYSVTSGSPHSQEGNLDTEAGPDIADMDGFNEEEFRPASEVFGDLDFLNQHGTSSSSVSHLARQSLYVNFDPLVGGRPSVLGRPSVAPFAARKLADQQQQDQDLIAINTLVSGPPTSQANKQQHQQPGHQNHNSESPAIGNGNTGTAAAAAADPNCNDTSYSTVEEKQARELEYQQNLIQKDQRYAELERQAERLQKEVEKLTKELKLRLESENQMKEVVKEYEKTISELISDNKREKTKLEMDLRKLEDEKNQALEDLGNVEAAFGDVHRKYERTKQIVDGFKKNEEELKKYVEEYKMKLRKSDQKYEALKAHAEEKLEEANREVENIARSQDAEIAKLSAMLKKAEMKTASLERTVEEKQKENIELTSICDDLISKVGS